MTHSQSVGVPNANRSGNHAFTDANGAYDFWDPAPPLAIARLFVTVSMTPGMSTMR
jgi:hypothetical protein